MAKSFYRVPGLILAGVLMVTLPAGAASLKSDADYLKRVAGSTSTVSAKRVARGYIAAQAYAIASNARFKRAVRAYAKGKSQRRVLAEARRGGQRWLSGISDNALTWRALSAAARTSIADRYAAREKKSKARLKKAQTKGRQLKKASDRVRQERGRAARGNPSSMSAAGLMAVFLALSTKDPNSEPAVAQEIASAVSKLESCIEGALSKRQSCLASSKNYYESAVCETTFTADSLACLSQ